MTIPNKSLQGAYQRALTQQQQLAQQQAPHGSYWQPSTSAYSGPAFGTYPGSGAFSRAITSIVTVPIPYAGIRAGEIIAPRFWWVDTSKMRLCSWAHYRLWEPGEPMYGDITKPVDGSIIMGGVYAFLDEAFASADEESTCRLIAAAFGNSKMRAIHFNDGTLKDVIYVRGTVKMWGEVVEHERGYRAEYAKVHTLDRIERGSWALLDRLREIYGVPRDERPVIDSKAWTG